MAFSECGVKKSGEAVLVGRARFEDARAFALERAGGQLTHTPRERSHRPLPPPTSPQKRRGRIERLVH
eukprot:scaffold84518_cov35-Tisochrysis_lutea.AAC.1